MTEHYRILKEERSIEAAMLNQIDFAAHAWYVLRVSHISMPTVRTKLQALGYYALYPVERKIKRPSTHVKSQSVIEISEVMPGYIFLGSSAPINWLKVLNTKHVYSVLGLQGRPMPAHPNQIRDMMYGDCTNTDCDRVLRTEALKLRGYTVGDTVTIAEGPFRGLSGRVLDFDKIGDAELALHGQSFSSIFIRPGMARKAS